MNVTLDIKFEYNVPMKLEKIPLNKFLSHLTNSYCLSVLKMVRGLLVGVCIEPIVSYH
jgi:hypothetical protein